MQATIHELQIMYKPERRFRPAAAKQSHVRHRGRNLRSAEAGTPPRTVVLPGAAGATTGWKDQEHRQPKTDPEGNAYGGGRADVRMAMGGDGELYVLSKSDGMIRKLAAVLTPPAHQK